MGGLRVLLGGGLTICSMRSAQTARNARAFLLCTSRRTQRAGLLLEDGGRMVWVNSKVIPALTPEGRALPNFPRGATAE